MIISASRRTDIPAFYASWFMNRVAAGECAVPNPFNAQQVATISLRPADVEAIVFWTRHPRPMLKHLRELDERGFRYYFQVTVIDYPRMLDPGTPAIRAAIESFVRLADRIGPERAVWRYDPIVLSSATGTAYHLDKFERIANALSGRAEKCIVSFVDVYRKLTKRLRRLAAEGAEIEPFNEERHAGWIRDLASIARSNRFTIESCAEEHDLAALGIHPGKCIDDRILRETLGIEVATRKDPSQRALCGCVASRDIGMYDSCVYGCRYCYATSSFARARANLARHDPSSPSLL